MSKSSPLSKEEILRRLQSPPDSGPAFDFVSDPDTGFYSSGVSQVTFVKGGIAQFTLSMPLPMPR